MVQYQLDLGGSRISYLNHQEHEFSSTPAGSPLPWTHFNYNLFISTATTPYMDG